MSLHPNGAPTGPQRGARNPRTLFRVRFSWASLFRWYALKNARVPPAIVLSRLRRGKNGQTPDPSFSRRGLRSFLSSHPEFLDVRRSKLIGIRLLKSLEAGLLWTKFEQFDTATNLLNLRSFTNSRIRANNVVSQHPYTRHRRFFGVVHAKETMTWDVSSVHRLGFYCRGR